MATRRIAQSSVNWSALAERVPPNQRPNFNLFKAKSDSYLRSVLANPENPPKIDWASYKNVIPLSGFVDKFQKEYDAIKVPYPADNVTSQIEAQEKEAKVEVNNFITASKDRIAGFEKEISHIKSLLPYDQMTMEDFRDAFPDLALDAINRPSYWPHTAEEALENQPKEAPSHG